MQDYKRLTKKDNNIILIGNEHGHLVISQEVFDMFVNEHKRLAELEDKIEDGTLIELPCKVRDTVYNTDGIRVYQGKIMEISLTPKHFIFTADTVCFDERAIGIRVFLTKAEAEAKLKGE